MEAERRSKTSDWGDTTERKLKTVRFMLIKREANVTLDLMDIPQNRYAATCRITDAAGKSILTVVHSDKIKSFLDPSGTLADQICCVALDEAFKKYMSALTQENRGLLKENGLRESEQTDIFAGAVHTIMEKSMKGDKYSIGLKFGSRIQVHVIISTKEAGKFDVHICAKDGCTLFKETGLCVKDASVEGYAQWLYAACENAVLSEEKRLLAKDHNIGQTMSRWSDDELSR